MKAERSLEWQRLYQKAISESDPEQLPEDIARAEAAVLSRLKNLTQDEEDEAEATAPPAQVPPPAAAKAAAAPAASVTDHTREPAKTV